MLYLENLAEKHQAHIVEIKLVYLRADIHVYTHYKRVVSFSGINICYLNPVN